jgi:hypothetical protein
MMEPFSTVILLASLAGMPATMARNWTLEKKERGTGHIPTTHLIIGSEKAATEHTFAVEPVQEQVFANAVTAELDGYGSLHDGWDGEDSVAPSSSDIASAIAFVDSLPSAIPLPKPMISSDGQIGLYWSKGEKYADINFDSDNTISLYVRDSSLTPAVERYVEGADPTDKGGEWLPMLLELLVPMKAAA